MFTNSYTRPAPDKEIISFLCGNRPENIVALHHTIEEITSLREIYPHLDLTELVRFSIGTYDGRKNSLCTFDSWITHIQSRYKFFVQMVDRGRTHFDYGEVDSIMAEDLRPFNPFGGTYFKKRVLDIPEGIVAILKNQLSERINLDKYDKEILELTKLQRGELPFEENGDIQANLEGIFDSFLLNIVTNLAKYPTNIN